MKILHLIYTTGISGAEKYLLNLLPPLKNYDIDCELICVAPKKNSLLLKQFCLQMEAKGIKATLLTTTSKFYFLNTARSVARYLKVNDIRIVHAHLFNADFLAVLVKLFFLKKVILLSTKHGYEEEYLIRYGEGNKNIPRYNLYYLISRFVISRIDHNITISRALSKMYTTLKLGKPGMDYIHHGINVQPKKDESINVGGYPKIMTVGRLARMKGQKYLIGALPFILDLFPDLRLLILGEGQLKESLEEYASKLGVSDNITFLGFTKPELYSANCQLMILPSLFEPFGLVYIESFALKIPVVAFDVEAGNEIIENNQTGILVADRTSAALAKEIIRLLKSENEMARIAENAYEKYLSYYNTGRMAKETAEWYHSILRVDD